ncbi:hypothetical protein [Pantoea anthophila]|uniref:hypothetical protein n=1 Tax=Pantoea anthophila TaxID=470931 RepID=UPI0028A20E78|nr:hypothetical protein [Pantoea anthophila]
MNRNQSAALILLLTALCSGSVAASACRPQSTTITNSNNLILLGGNAKGAVKQVIAGEFGKDVNSQKRVLGQFDACGDLTVADVSYDKNERNVILSMEQHIARVQGGWVAEYAYLVKVLKEGKEVVVDNRQGTINWQKGEHGNITSASDKFISMGKSGFTDTTYRYDRQLRLEKSVARGSDPTASTPLSTIRSVDECQSWDEVGNCTLSYLHETEIFTRGTIERHLSSAYKYEYWDQPAAEE